MSRAPATTTGAGDLQAGHRRSPQRVAYPSTSPTTARVGPSLRAGVPESADDGDRRRASAVGGLVAQKAKLVRCAARILQLDTNLPEERAPNMPIWFRPISAFTILALAACILSSPAASGTSSGSSAARTSSSGDLFYDVPEQLPKPSAHGRLLRFRKVDLHMQSLSSNGYQVMYASTGADPRLRPKRSGSTTAVTGIVLVPRTPWHGPGDRPVIALAPGTHGLGIECSPSRTMTQFSEYQGLDPTLLLARNFAVAITDYQGYTTGGTHPYAVGHVLGRNVLDIVRATTQLPGSGVSVRSPVAIWGYSEGGSGGSWAGQLAPHYTPWMKIKGVAVGGVPFDLIEVGRHLNRHNLAFDYLLAALIGFHAAYPELPFEEILNSRGRDAVRALRRPGQCTLQTILNHPFGNLSRYNTLGMDLDDLLEVYPEWQRTLDANRLGRTAIDAPTLIYYAKGDTIVTPVTQVRQAPAYCRLGMVVNEWVAPAPVEHITMQFLSLTGVSGWLANRIKGRPVSNQCETILERS